MSQSWCAASTIARLLTAKFAYCVVLCLARLWFFPSPEAFAQPLLLALAPGEKSGSIKTRCKTKLRVPDSEFKSWRLVRCGRTGKVHLKDDESWDSDAVSLPDGDGAGTGIEDRQGRDSRAQNVLCGSGALLKNWTAYVSRVVGVWDFDLGVVFALVGVSRDALAGQPTTEDTLTRVLGLRRVWKSRRYHIRNVWGFLSSFVLVALPYTRRH